MSRYALQRRKNTLPRRREALERRNAWWIRDCTLEITHHPIEWADDYGMLQLYDSGRRTGTLTATIVSESAPQNAGDMLNRNVVFEWPDRTLFIAMRIERVGITSVAGALTETEVEGVVLGMIEYTDQLARKDAHVRAQRLLTDGHP